MLNGTNVKVRYEIKDKIVEKSMKLNANENLENNLKQVENKNNFCEFHLLRNKTKILLDKNIKTKDLNLKEGDLILVSFKNKVNESQNTKHTHNDSSANINEDISSSTDSTSVRHSSSKKTKFILLLILIGLVFISVCFGILYYIFHKRDAKNESKNDKMIDENNKDKKADIISTEIINPQIEPNFQKEDLVVKKM